MKSIRFTVVILLSAVTLPVYASDAHETTQSSAQAQSKAQAFKAMTPEERKLKVQAGRERMKQYRADRHAVQ